MTLEMKKENELLFTKLLHDRLTDDELECLYLEEDDSDEKEDLNFDEDNE